MRFSVRIMTFSNHEVKPFRKMFFSLQDLVSLSILIQPLQVKINLSIGLILKNYKHPFGPIQGLSATQNLNHFAMVNEIFSHKQFGTSRKNLYLLGFDCCNYWQANGMIYERVFFGFDYGENDWVYVDVWRFREGPPNAAL